MEKYKVISRSRAWKVLILTFLAAWFGFLADVVAWSSWVERTDLPLLEFLAMLGALTAFTIATYSFIRACRDHTEHYSSSVLNSSISWFYSLVALVILYVVH